MPENTMHEDNPSDYELSVVMPCLNESETIGICIGKAKDFFARNNVHGEVVIADNGSTDNSIEIANSLGARVVMIKERGYGSALSGGIKNANGRYIIMGDSDDSYDFLNLMPYIEKLRQGYDLVMGNRFKGGIMPGAMPFLHRYLGNPVLSFVGRLFFKSKIADFHCGLRGFTKDAFNRMDLQTTGMEFASEMVVKATLSGMKIAEVPTVLSVDGRSGRPHLRSFRDGWRHLRFLLLYSPRWLFLYPGLAMILFGLIFAFWIVPAGLLPLGIHTMLFAASAIIMGFQAVSFAILTRTYAAQEKLLPNRGRFDWFMKKATLEKGLVFGGILVFTGVGFLIYIVSLLGKGDFPQLGYETTMRIVISSSTLLVLGIQISFFSFFYSIIRLKLRRED